MTERQIHITQFDQERLEELIEVAEAAGGKGRDDLRLLREELARAVIVPPDQMPADVVTMNSQVLLRDLDTGEEITCTLAFPEEANIDVGAISVLAPVGTAILGYHEGDEIEWPVPAGSRRLVIVKLSYQPEAAGDFGL